VRKTKKVRQIGVRLDPELEEAVESISRQTKLTIAELVRLCIERQIDTIAKDGGILLKVKLPGKS
jgi:predicted DNA-binding protein